MAMLDEGETDWKLIAIDTKDPMADKLHGKIEYKFKLIMLYLLFFI